VITGTARSGEDCVIDRQSAHSASATSSGPRSARERTADSQSTRCGDNDEGGSAFVPSSRVRGASCGRTRALEAQTSRGSLLAVFDVKQSLNALSIGAIARTESQTQ
jgi:hypothetical protein